MRNCSDCVNMRTTLLVKPSGRINFTGLTAQCIKGHFQNEDGDGETFRLYRDRTPKGWNEAEHCNDFAKVDFVKEILKLSNKAKALNL